MWYNIATTDHLTAHSILISVLTVLPIGYSVIVALTGLPIGYSVIVALTGLPIGYSVIVALTSLPIGYSVIIALTIVNKIISNHSHIPSWKIRGWWALYM